MLLSNVAANSTKNGCFNSYNNCCSSTIYSNLRLSSTDSFVIYFKAYNFPFPLCLTFYIIIIIYLNILHCYLLFRCTSKTRNHWCGATSSRVILICILLLNIINLGIYQCFDRALVNNYPILRFNQLFLKL